MAINDGMSYVVAYPFLFLIAAFGFILALKPSCRILGRRNIPVNYHEYDAERGREEAITAD